MRYSPWFVDGQWMEAPAWPVVLAALTLAPAVTAFGFAWLANLKGWRARLGVLLIGGLGAGLGLGLGGVVALFGLEGIERDLWIQSAWAHAFPIAVAAGLSAAGLGSALGSIAAALSNPAPESGDPRESRRPRAIVAALISVVGGVLATVVATSWSGWLVSHGPVPLILPLPGTLRVHVGAVFTPVTTLAAVPGTSWRPVPHDTFTATTLGVMPLDQFAASGALRTGKRTELEVGANTYDPRMPLAIGNTWSFSHHGSRGVQTARLANPDGTRKSNNVSLALQPVAVAVKAVREQAGLQVFVMKVTGAPDASVYGWNGSTVDLETGEPIFRDNNGQTQVTLLWDYLCTFGEADASRFLLPGPDQCTHTGVSSENVVTSTLTTVFTLGTINPGLSSTRKLSRVSSGPATASPTP